MNSFSKELYDNISREAVRFYKQIAVSEAKNASDRSFQAIEVYIADLSAWVAEQPSPHSKDKGKGRPQTEPSQKRIHVIAELEQFANFCEENSDRQPGQTWRRTPLKGRRFLSRYAVSALIGDRLLGCAFVSPIIPADEKHLQQKETLPWGHDADGKDAGLLKRAIGTLSDQERPSLLRIVRRDQALNVESREFLQSASGNYSQHIKIDDLLKFLTPDLISSFEAQSRSAAAALRIVFDIPDSMRSDGRTRTIAEFISPAPIYSLIKRLISSYWPSALEVTQNQRLFHGEATRLALEDSFGRFCIKAVDFAMDRINQAGFDPFAGIKASEIIDDYDVTVKDEEWPQYRDDIVKRIANRIIRHREQVIILNDFAETARRLTEKFGEAVSPGYSDLLEEFNSYGFYKLLDWAREAQTQYDEGIFYKFDRLRKERGDPKDIRLMSVEILQRGYAVGGVDGPARYADVGAAELKQILDVLHYDEPQRQRRLAAALAEFERLVAPHAGDKRPV